MLKKKVFSLVLAVLMLAGLGLVLIPAQANTPNYGDVDGNGYINAADVTLLRRRVSQGNADGLPNFNAPNADVNGDDSIDINDVNLLRRHVAAVDPSTVRLGPQGRRNVKRSDFPANKRFVALTFDDGPNTTYTPGVLEGLKTHGAAATFYVNGAKITAQTIPILQQMIREGHDVDNHSWNHASFGQPIDSMPNVTTQAEAITNLRNTSQAIFNATGYWPFSFRPPFLELGAWMSGLDSEVQHLGRLPFIDTGIDTNDYQRQSEGGAQLIANTVINATRPANLWPPAQSHPDGGIVLLHDCGGSRPQTVLSLGLFIPQMKAANPGYEFLTVRQLFQVTDSNPEVWTGVTMWPRVNQWVPVSNRNWADPIYIWTTPPADTWYTNPTPPWNR